MPLPAPSLHEVSHLLEGLLLTIPCGLVSCRCRPWGFHLQSFSHRTSRDHLRPLTHLTLRAFSLIALRLMTPTSDFEVLASPSPPRPLRLWSRCLLGLAPARRPFTHVSGLVPHTCRYSPGVFLLQGSKSLWTSTLHPAPLLPFFKGRIMTSWLASSPHELSVRRPWFFRVSCTKGT